MRQSKYDIETGRHNKNQEFDCCSYMPRFIDDTWDNFKALSTFQKIKFIFNVFLFCFWFILAMTGIAIGSGYINQPICTKMINQTLNQTSLLINNTYGQEIDKITPTVNLDIWLIVNGVIWMFSLILVLIYMFITATRDKYKDFGRADNGESCIKRSKNHYFDYFGLYIFIFELFLFVWVIIGAVSVWRDCNENINQNIKICMTLTIISELLNIILFMLWIINMFIWKMLEIFGY